MAMVKREELLSDLKKYLDFEEESIAKLVTFLQVTNWRSSIEAASQRSVAAGLQKIKEDSERHAEIFKDMIDYIERSDADEF